MNVSGDGVVQWNTDNSNSVAYRVSEDGIAAGACDNLLEVEVPGNVAADALNNPVLAEILVSGATALGYCGTPASAHDPWPTGDLGYLADGFLYLTGRKKNIFITSFGRNVSPEWVEAELTTAPAIAQAWVWGEGRPWNTAVITPAHGCTSFDYCSKLSNPDP